MTIRSFRRKTHTKIRQEEIFVENSCSTTTTTQQRLFKILMAIISPKGTSHRAWADIDLNALSHNWEVARKSCATQTLLPVIKANGYGHGLEEIAGQLMKDTVRMEGVAVAALSEAKRLRACGVGIPIVLLPGFVTSSELQECAELHLDPVLHSKYQVDMLLAFQGETKDSGTGSGCFTRFWLKADTGMHRLGMSSSDWLGCYSALVDAFPSVKLVAMSHLACADDPSSSATPAQAQSLFQLTRSCQATPPPLSLAASGGILAWPETHCDIVRPGIMLYGSSPLADKSAKELDLRPVMTLRSRVIAINSVQPGDPVGYGQAFVAHKPMRIGVVSIGYGDGYPRQAPTGTPVLVWCGDWQRVTLVGRVSMDMITVDLTGVRLAEEEAGEGGVRVGAEVVLWGAGLPAEEVAGECGTISYELFCQVTPRVPRVLM